MTDISTTAIEIVPTPLEDVVSQDNFQDVQEIGSFLNETNNNSYLDKFCKSFKTLKKIFDFFRTLTLYWLKYGLWIKYFLAFVVFILLPLGVYSLCKIILFLFKSMAFLSKKAYQYFQKKRTFEMELTQDLTPVNLNTINTGASSVLNIVNFCFCYLFIRKPIVT